MKSENFRLPTKQIPIDSFFEAVGKPAFSAISRTDMCCNDFISSKHISLLFVDPLFVFVLWSSKLFSCFLISSPNGNIAFDSPIPFTAHKKYDWSLLRSAPDSKSGDGFFPSCIPQLYIHSSSGNPETYNFTSDSISKQDSLRCHSLA